MPRVLIVDDEAMPLRHLAELVAAQGYQPVLAESGAAALKILLADQGFAAMILDLVMPDMDGMAVMEAMRREAINVPVIVQTSNASPELIRSVMRHGAMDYFVKPVSPERLMVSLSHALCERARDRALRVLQARAEYRLTLADLIGQGSALERVKLLAARAAKMPLPVLIEGEQGAGKQMLARMITDMGERAGKPFISVHCAQMAPQQVEIALFGRAGSDQQGAFRTAQGGTLYIDEVSEIPPSVQEKLLTAIADGEITPIGATRPERVNVRIIASSSRRLMHVTRDGHFRDDLYYRLHVLPLYVPPLRERREDIAALADHFIALAAAETGRPVMGLAPDTLAMLETYDWPGNVEQLEHAVFRGVAISQASLLEVADFPHILARLAGANIARDAVAQTPLAQAPSHIDIAGPRRRPDTDIKAGPFIDAEGEVVPIDAIERQLIIFAIEHHHGRMSRVARALGIGRSTLYRKLREYGLDEHIERDVA